MAINTDCGTCPLAENCYMKDKHQRLSQDDGGLELCPKLALSHDFRGPTPLCSRCHFTGKVGDRGGAKIHDHRTCLLLPGEPDVQGVKSHKQSCPLRIQVLAECSGR